MKVDKQILDYIKDSIDEDIREMTESQLDSLDVDFNENTQQQILNNIFSRIHKRAKKRRYMFIGAAVAAVLVLISSVFFQMNFFQNDLRYHEITVDNGEKLVVLLSDGSKAWLNAGSKLIYPEQFAKNKRDVYMTGEVYFEIANNPAKPFFVNVEDMVVEVIGTSFNVNAYPENDDVTVYLKEGKVELSLPGNKYPNVLISPGETLIYSKSRNKSTVVANEEYDIMSRWKEDEMSFFNTPLKKVLATMERYYDVKFTIADERVLTYTYTFSSQKEPIDKILEKMEIITPIIVEKNNQKKYTLKSRKY